MDKDKLLNDLKKGIIEVEDLDQETIEKYALDIVRMYFDIGVRLTDFPLYFQTNPQIIDLIINEYDLNYLQGIKNEEYLRSNFDLIISKIPNSNKLPYIDVFPIDLQGSPKLIDAYIEAGELTKIAETPNKYYLNNKINEIIKKVNEGSYINLRNFPQEFRTSTSMIDAILNSPNLGIDALEGVNNKDYLDTKKDLIIKKINEKHRYCSLNRFSQSLRSSLIEVYINDMNNTNNYVNTYLFNQEDLPLVEDTINNIVLNSNIRPDLLTLVSNSNKVFNTIIKQNRVELLRYFKPSVLTQDNIDILVRQLEKETNFKLDNMPDYIKKSNDIASELIKRHDLKFLKYIDESAIIANKDLLLTEINNGLIINNYINDLPNSIKSDIEIIDAMLKNNDTEALVYASNEYLTANIDNIIKAINNDASFIIDEHMPNEIKSSKEIVLALIKKGQLKSIKNANNEVFDKEVIDSFIAYITSTKKEAFYQDILGDFKDYPLSLRSSIPVILAIINNRKAASIQGGTIFEDPIFYILKGITNEFLNEHFSDLLSYIKIDDGHIIIYIEENFNLNHDNKVLLWKTTLNKIIMFPDLFKAIPDDILPDIENDILNSFEKIPSNQVFPLDLLSNKIKENPKFYHIFLKRCDIDQLLNDPIISKYIDEDTIISEIINNNKIIGFNHLPDKLKRSKKILHTLLSLNNLTLIYGADKSIIDDEIIDLIAKKITDHTLNIDSYTFIEAPKFILNSPVILDSLINEKYLPYIHSFNKEAFTEDNILKIFKTINKDSNRNLNFLKDLIDIKYFENPNIFNYLLDLYKQGDPDILWIIPESVLEKNKDIIIANFPYKEFINSNKNFNNLIDILELSDEIVKNLIDLNYIKFNPNYHCYESLINNIDYLCQKINNNEISFTNCSDLDYYFINDPRVIKSILNKGNLNALYNSVEGGYNKENLTTINNLLISGKKLNSITYLPESIRYSQEILTGIIKSNSFDLLYDVPKEIIDNNMELIANNLGITKEELHKKIDFLYTKNDELFTTFNIALLNDKFNKLDISLIERISLYKDIQETIITIANNDKKLDTFILIANKLWNNKENIDINDIIYKVINALNGNEYNELINNLDLNSLSNEQIDNLILTFKDNKNIYSINHNDDLTNDNYSNKQDEYFKRINESIEKGSITLEELQEATLEKCFNIDLITAKFLYERYCFNVDGLNNIDNEKEKERMKPFFEIFKLINNIMESNMEDLVDIYNNLNFKTQIDYKSSSLDAIIRREYANTFSDSLYKLQDKDISDKPFLRDVRYKGEDIPVYEVDDDFKMQTHALGAYREWELPKDFSEDWNRPKIAFHGICTSYISNDLIATAITKHPILGFSEYEPSALLLSGNYDLYSDEAIANYNTSSSKPYTFLPPSLMVNYTRHNHNEMVLERRVNKDNVEGFKRQPSYVIYVTNNMNPNNFTDDKHLWMETKQAAKDFNIPIVIVDRNKFVLKELDKCQELENEFNRTFNPQILNKLITKYINNSVSCRFDDPNTVADIQSFTPEKTIELYERIINKTMELININEYDKILNIIDELLNIIEIENKCINMSHKSDLLDKTFDYEKEKERLTKLKEEVINLQYEMGDNHEKTFT